MERARTRRGGRSSAAQGRMPAPRGRARVRAVVCMAAPPFTCGSSSATATPRSPCASGTVPTCACPCQRFHGARRRWCRAGRRPVAWHPWTSSPAATSSSPFGWIGSARGSSTATWGPAELREIASRGAGAARRRAARRGDGPGGRWPSRLDGDDPATVRRRRWFDGAASGPERPGAPGRWRGDRLPRSRRGALRRAHPARAGPGPAHRAHAPRCDPCPGPRRSTSGWRRCANRSVCRPGRSSAPFVPLHSDSGRPPRGTSRSRRTRRSNGSRRTTSPGVPTPSSSATA